jgi:hypothetical protein
MIKLNSPMNLIWSTLVRHTSNIIKGYQHRPVWLITQRGPSNRTTLKSPVHQTTEPRGG